MMLKEKKLEFQQELEDTIEEHKIYELFEGMMKSLIINKPEDPIDYLIKSLEQTERKQFTIFKKNHQNGDLFYLLRISNNDRFICILAKRYVVIGPPGSESHDISLRMVEQLKENAGGIECVNLGDKFNSEMTKR